MSMLDPKITIQNKVDILEQNILAAIFGKAAGACIHGPSGSGKTTNIVAILKKHKIDFIYFPIYSSPLALAKILYENRKSVLLLDDVAESKHPLILSILKSLLTSDPITGNRTVHLNISIPVLKREGMEHQQFEFDGTLLFATNKYDPNASAHAKAIGSRMPDYYFELTFEEKKYLINQFSKTPGKYGLTELEMLPLIDFLNKHLTPACDGVDLRILEKAAAIVKGSPSTWQKGVANLVKVDPRYNTICTVIEMCDSAELPKSARPKAFTHLTGLSRSTYFDLIKRFGIEANETLKFSSDENSKQLLKSFLRTGNQKVQNSSQIQEHTDKEVDMMSTGVQ